MGKKRVNDDASISIAEVVGGQFDGAPVILVEGVATDGRHAMIVLPVESALPLGRALLEFASEHTSPDTAERLRAAIEVLGQEPGD
jgi:hypothetical protein